MLDAGVVHQDVHMAEFFSGKGHHGLDFGGLAHVGAVVGHLGAKRGDFLLRRLGVAKTVEHDVGALGGQRFGDAQADAAGGAGDEGGFIFQHG